MGRPRSTSPGSHTRACPPSTTGPPPRRFKQKIFCGPPNRILTREADVAVIGGGFGGYVCASRAAQLGLKTVLIEKDRLGGECLTAGCIPSKAIISVSKLYEKVRTSGAGMGIIADGVRVDMPAMQRWKAGIIATLESGIATLCKGNKVEVIKGTAEVVDARRLKVRTKEGEEEVVTKNLVIATGSRPISLPGLEFDEKLGSKITIVELTDQLLPGTEPDLVRFALRNLEKGGAQIYLKSKVASLEKSGGLVKARISH